MAIFTELPVLGATIAAVAFAAVLIFASIEDAVKHGK